MISVNKLDKSFGPVGSTSGIFLFIAGLALVYFNLSGLFLILLGAFVGFTSTCTIVDSNNKRIKFATNLFGVFKFGKWIDLEPEMTLGIKKSNKDWRTYSQGNRTLDISNSDYRIVLYNKSNHEIIPIKKVMSIELANAELEKLSALLGLSIN